MKYIMACLMSMLMMCAYASTKTQIESQLSQGQFNTALDTINSKLSDTSLIDSQKAVLHYYKAQALLHLNKKDEAKQSLTMANQLDESHLFNQSMKFSAIQTQINANPVVNVNSYNPIQLQPIKESHSYGLLWVIVFLAIIGMVGYFTKDWWKAKFSKKKEIEQAKQNAKDDQKTAGIVIGDLTDIITRYKELNVDLKIRDKSLDDLTSSVKDEQESATSLLKQMIQYKDGLDQLLTATTFNLEQYQSVQALLPEDIGAKMNQLFDNVEAIEFAVQNNTNLNT